MGRRLAIATYFHCGEDLRIIAAGQVIGCLLIVQAWSKEERVPPGRATAKNGTLGNGAQVGQDDEA